MEGPIRNTAMKVPIPIGPPIIKDTTSKMTLTTVFEAPRLNLESFCIATIKPSTGLSAN